MSQTKATPESLLLELHNARTDLASATAEIKRAEEAMKATEAYQIAAELKKAASTKAADLEEKIRTLLLAEHKKNGSISLQRGAEVKNKTIFEVTDEAAAIKWCEDNMPVAIERKINMKAFKPVITGMFARKEPVSFVKVGKEPAVYFASDLSFLVPVVLPNEAETTQEDSVQDWRDLCDS